ncbi:MAG: nuclear transport factor 2 family protein [Flavipsychrobacter sp.]
MRYLFILLLLVLSACGQHQLEEQAIEELLHQQAAAWNSGDLEQYMELGYWHNDSLVFIGSRGPTYGFDATLINYKRSYPTNEKMGQLRFSNLKFKRLSSTYYFVIGSWALARTDGDLNGHFSLLFRKINGSWKIVADHSS